MKTEQLEKKKSGRKEGRTQTAISVRVNDDLLAWVKSVGKQNQIINLALQHYKTSLEL